MFSPIQQTHHLARLADKLDPEDAWKRSLRTGVVGITVLAVSAITFVVFYRTSRSEVALLAALPAFVGYLMSTALLALPGLHHRRQSLAADREALLAGAFVDLDSTVVIERGGPGVARENRPRTYTATVTTADGRKVTLREPNRSDLETVVAHIALPFRDLWAAKSEAYGDEPARDVSLQATLMQSLRWTALTIGGFALAGTIAGLAGFF